MKLHTGLAALALACLGACSSPPPREARVGEEARFQVATFEKLFDTREGLCDLRLVTRDFREEMARVEHTTILAYRGGRYSSLDVVTCDRKVMGKTGVRHRIASLWPVDLHDDPSNRVLLLVEAQADFVTEAGAGATAVPGIATLEVSIRLVCLERNGDLVVKDPERSEGVKAVALALGAPEDERPPLHWNLVLQFFLAERDRARDQEAKAAAAYQRIVDQVAHTRGGEDADDHPSDLFDLANIDYLREIANQRLAALK